MNVSEARLQLMRPAWALMSYVDQQFQAVEDGRATPDQALSWIRTANRKIEDLVLSDDLRIAMLDEVKGDDRYRLKHFLKRP